MRKFRTRGQAASAVKSRVTNSPAVMVPQIAMPFHHDGPCTLARPGHGVNEDQMKLDQPQCEIGRDRRAWNAWLKGGHLSSAH